MSLISIFDISGSALTAQGQRINVNASNIANVDSITTADNQPYRAKRVIFEVQPSLGLPSSDHPVGGVRIKEVIQDTKTPFRLVYQPGNPMADAKGYVRMPNVEITNEMTDTIAASRSYQANIEVLNTAKALMNETLNLTK